MARQQVEDKKVQKSIYLSESTWKLIEKTFGWGKASANIERILREHLGNKDAERVSAMVALEEKVKLYNFLYNRRLELRVKEEVPLPPPEEKDEVQP